MGESSSSCENNDKKRVRGDPDEPDFDSPEVKRLRDDLFGVLEGSDPVPATQDLESVIKSLENEISASSERDSGVTQPDLGYLLEASDDELGLPPTTASAEAPKEGGECWSELFRVSSDSSGVGELWDGFDEPLPSYDSFELGGVVGSYGTEYAALDGLFEYADARYDSCDLTALRQETLP